MDYLLSCEIGHGLELISAFIEERAERDLQHIYYFTQPNSFNKENSFTDFKKSLMRDRQPVKTEAEIMVEVRDIMAMFEPKEGAHGDI